MEADIVVVGEIVRSGPGREVGPEGEPGVQFIETELLIREVIKVQPAFSEKLDSGSTVLVETELIGDEKSEGQLGTEVVALLWLKRDDESSGRYFRPITPGAWLDTDGDQVESGRALEDSVGAELEALGLAGIRRAATSE